VYNTTSGNVELGGQAITTTAATVTAGTGGGSSTAGQTFTLTTGTDTVTGTAGNDTINATMATMQSLDTVDGGAGTDTLSIRDTVAVTALTGTYTGIETVSVYSAASVGAATTAAVLAAKQEVQYNFGAAGVSLGSAPNKSIVDVTVGGVTRTVGDATTAATATTIAAAIDRILDEGVGAANWTSVSGSVVTVTAATAGVALPTITIAAGTGGDGVFTATNATTDPFSKTLQSNQVGAAAITGSTFVAPTGATTVSIEAGTTANVSSASTAATTVSAGGAVVLSGGVSQTVTTYDSVRVSGGTGAVTVTALVKPSTNIAAVSNTGWSSDAPGVFVRGGTTVSVTETAGSSTSGSIPSGNSTKIQIGSDPTTAVGHVSGGAITSNVLTGAQAIGNLSSAPTGDVSIVARTNYTGIGTADTNTNGLTNVKYGTGAVSVFMNGGSTASVTGAGTVSITDIQTTLTKASSTADALPGVSKLATVNLTGVSGATAIKSDAIATVSAVDTSSTVTITSNVGANTGNIALNVANSSVTLVDADASSVSVGSAAGSGRQAIANTPVSATQASAVTLTTAAAKSLAFSGANEVTLAASTLSALTSITSSASGTVNLGTATDYAKLTSADMSGGTGSVTVTLGATIAGNATDRGFAYTGSAGTDVVSLTGAMKSGTNAAGAAVANTINLGAGNDMLLKGGTNGAIAAGSTANGGDGVDTIAASLLTAGNAAQITGFEQLGLDLTSGSYDTDLLSGATGFVLLAQGGTYTNVEQAQSLSVVQNVGANGTTLTFSTANVAGSSDSYSVNFAAKGSTSAASPTSIDAGTLVISGIENVTINSGAASGFVNNTIDLTAANLKTVTVTGSALVTTLGFASTNGTNVTGVGGAVSSIDASALTGKLVLDTSNITVNNAADFAGLSVKSGAGADALTLASYAIVDSGAGADTITLNAAGGIVTTGAGKDIVKVGSVVAHDGTAATGKSVVITDFAVGDSLDFINATDSSTATVGVVQKLTLTNEASLSDAITSAINLSSASSGTPKEVTWFVYSGNTYVVYDAADDIATNGGLAANDVIVRLNGVFDLSNSTFDSTNGTFTFG